MSTNAQANPLPLLEGFTAEEIDEALKSLPIREPNFFDTAATIALAALLDRQADEQRALTEAEVDAILNEVLGSPIILTRATTINK
ncbi:hypothetical protein [Paraburkholderia sp. BL21I4N1]|uniref:hypothetical protein n=1 Tax=Paraburkholderia sp. BL21I4N1 TaxID=1938801 RepID=UPI000CFD6D1F|nr:hypothetical protein [Paraburkholderia sp. BL21I4N1]PQV53394.1 hypothetical protein B0G83_102480 [Paraburkholderia sp. BL21I4N1]